MNGEYMTKRATTPELTELYENEMMYQEIGDGDGISGQRVQQRFKDAGLVSSPAPDKIHSNRQSPS